MVPQGGMPERLHQVFVSSTSTDLEEPRRKVIEILLEADFIPVGMELFKAATEAVWPSIIRLIDRCDYYVVIVAGRYGSLRADGLSYTESEYEYAKSKGKPILAFIHGDIRRIPSGDVEETDELKNKLDRFRSKLQSDRRCRLWFERGDLAASVLAGVNGAIRSDPQPGWIRADAPDVIPAQLRAGLVEPTQTLGIGRISVDGLAGPAMSQHLAAARAIAIMSTSAVRVVDIQLPSIVNALAAGCRVRVLVPEPDSAFLADVEESESEDGKRGGSISDEIREVEDRLRQAVGQARRSAGNVNIDFTGSVEMGYFTSHLRSTMLICDDTWGWVTMTLPPARAPETPSFEVTNVGRHPLLNACLRHFNRTWAIVEQRHAVKAIGADI